MNDYILQVKVAESLKYFLASLKNSYWAVTATEETIDSMFKCATELKEISQQEKESSVICDILQSYPNFQIENTVDILIENILRNHNLDENLILYAIEKYTLFYPKSDLFKLLDKTLSEIELRSNLFKLYDEFPDVYSHFYTLNNFLCETLNSSDLRSKILNALKAQTLVFLKSVNISTVSSGLHMLEEMVVCLEAQTDLKLWFIIMKDEYLDIVLDLCTRYKNFLRAVFKFFDKYAYETESNYDEDLNVIYSHLNLNFEDFVQILQLFLNKISIKQAVLDYLESKTLIDKNFCFWIDVKACLLKI